MKILFVDDPPLFSGGQRMLVNYIDALAGEDVALVRPLAAPEPDSTWHVRALRKLKFPEYPARMSSLASQAKMLPQVAALVFRLFLTLMKERPDICMANSFYALIPLVTLKALFRFRLAFMAHTMDIPLNKSVKFLLERCDAVYACCDAAGARLEKIVPIRPTTIRNATAPSKKAGAPRETKEGEFKIVFATRMIQEKNPLNLAKAVKLLRDGGFNASLALFGDGPEKETVERFVRENKLEEAIVVRGFVNNAADETCAADCLCLPTESEAEALPVCILEALSAGTPVVATRKGGLAEALVEGSTGVFASSASPEDLAAAIKKVAALDRATLARNAVKLYEAKFALEVQAKAFRQAMEALAKKPK